MWDLELMTTTDWAIIISIGALLVSLASFIWNIWSKFIYPKPRIQVSMALMSLLEGGQFRGPRAIALHATNHGPSEAALYMAIARSPRRYPWKRPGHAILNPFNRFPPRNDNDTAGPFSGGLRKKLAVGEQFSSYFPDNVEWFSAGYRDFGFEDTFGRKLWCLRRGVDKIRKELTDRPAPQRRRLEDCAAR